MRSLTPFFCTPGRFFLFFSLLVSVVILPLQTAAAREVAGTVVHAAGQVFFSRAGGAFQPAVSGQNLYEKDRVKTGPTGAASLLLADETLVKLNKNSLFELSKVTVSAGWRAKVKKASLSGAGRSLYRLLSGELWMRNKNRRPAIDISTPSVTASIRGTEMNLLMDSDGTVYLSVLEGVVRAENPLGFVLANAMEQAVVRPGQAPVKRVLLNPKDAVQWVLWVPDLMKPRQLSLLPMTHARAAQDVRRLEQKAKQQPLDPADLVHLGRLYRDLGDLARALNIAGSLTRKSPVPGGAAALMGWLELDQNRPDIALKWFEKAGEKEPSAAVGLAAALWAMGKEDPAAKAARRAASLFPDHPLTILCHAFLEVRSGRLTHARDLLVSHLDTDLKNSAQARAFLGLIHVILGDVDKGIAAVDKALALEPESSTAWVVKSYALTAGHFLDPALGAANQAVTLAPDSLTALLLRARLNFGFDRSDRAAADLKKAMAIHPDSAEALSLLGFVQMADGKTKKALNTFRHAAKLDTSMGEPHLGAALCLMRLGRVPTAMEEMTTAVLLEPRRSLFLSYWAKILYQDQRPKQALDMLEMAGRLDPNDPTPHLYRAIIFRDLNRPDEAVAALNKAVALNDNRAVYRSRLLLDRDLAVKNVDQSLVYGMLGLSEWAKNKALASVKTDYRNSAGHIFLAGAIQGTGRHLRTERSERLLGLILQPANINSFNSFNEYTTMFEQPGINGVLSGSAGNRDTYGGSLIAYGGVPEADLAFSGIVDAATTDGWRNEHHYRTRGGIVNAKWDLSQNQGLFLKASTGKVAQQGDQTSHYLWDAVPDPDEWYHSETANLTAAYHAHPWSNADVFVNFIYQSDTTKGQDNTLYLLEADPDRYLLDERYEYDVDLPYGQGQVHSIFRLGDHQLVTGAVFGSRKRDLDQIVVTDNYYEYQQYYYYLYTDTQETKRHVRELFQSYYVHDIWHIFPKLTAEAGLSLDLMDRTQLFDPGSPTWRIQELNPRAGLIYTPFPRHTFRLAAFRFIVPFIFERLDPSDVAGIPVYRNGYEGSRAVEVDLAWEYEWGSGFFSADLFHLKMEDEDRYLNEYTLSEYAVKYDNKSKGVELAVNQMLGHGLGLRAAYRFMDVESDFRPETERRDHLAGLSLTWVDKSGIFASVGQTLRYIDAKNGEDETAAPFDVGLYYEFPGKKGLAGLQITNLFNSHFNWVVDDFAFGGRVPERQVAASLSLYF